MSGTSNATFDLIAHSGGGSFIFGYINAVSQLPDRLQHIAFIDANYSYSDEDDHGDKLLQWLRASARHRLVVLAYDDRRVTVNSELIVSETGGTWRATDRMTRRLEQDVEFSAGEKNDLQTSFGLDKRIVSARHPNTENRILHTVLVEKNGFVYSAATGRVELQPGDELYATTETYRTLILP